MDSKADNTTLFDTPPSAIVSKNDIPEDSLVLIVDDNFTNSNILSELLKSYGYQTCIAESGPEALMQAKTEQPDLILLDIMMPGMDGFETSQRLKAEPGTRYIPIIFMTALSNPDHLAEGFRHGAVDYIRKPYSREEVVARVSTHILMQREQQRLSQVNASKDQLFSVISHDLKRPFSTLLGFSDLLLKNFDVYDDDKKVQYIRKIYQTSENTFRLLDNLLNWTKLQFNDLHCKPESVDLTHAIVENIAFIKNCANTKEIQITHTVPAQAQVWVDPNMLSVILLNLLSNAVKFTEPKGRIQVSVTQGFDEVCIQVSDSGQGIEPENMKKLFDPTTYYSTMGTALEKGSGIGLSLCKEFAEKNNGRLSATSTPGAGSCFCLHLPATG